MASASFEQMSQAELQTAIGNSAEQISRMHDLQQSFTKGTHTFTSSGDRVGGARSRVSSGWDGKAHSAADAAMSSMHDYMAQSQAASQSSAKTMSSMATTTRSHNTQAQSIKTVDTSFGASMRAHPHNPFGAVADNVERHQEADANHAKAVAVAKSLDEQGTSHANSMQAASWPTLPQSAGSPPSDIPPPPGAGGTSGGPGGGSSYTPGGGGGGSAVPVIGASRGRYTPTEESPGTGRKRKSVFEEDPAGGGKTRTPVPTTPGAGTPGLSTDPSGLDSPVGSGAGAPGVEPVAGSNGGPGSGGAGAGGGALAGVGLGAGAIGLRGAAGGGALGRGAGAGLEEGHGPGAGRGAAGEAEEGRLPGGRAGAGAGDGEATNLRGRGAAGNGAGAGEGEGENVRGRGLGGNDAGLGEGESSGPGRGAGTAEPFEGRGTDPGLRLGSSGAAAEELGAGRGGMGPMGGSGRRRSDDEQEHGLPDYLVESEDFWAGEQSGSPAVIGE